MDTVALERARLLLVFQFEDVAENFAMPDAAGLLIGPADTALTADVLRGREIGRHILHRLASGAALGDTHAL